jgi:hypothetical protein
LLIIEFIEVEIAAWFDRLTTNGFYYSLTNGFYYSPMNGFFITSPQKALILSAHPAPVEGHELGMTFKYSFYFWYRSSSAWVPVGENCLHGNRALR